MFYLLCTLLFIGFAEAAELRCNQTVFIQCQENFAKGLGFDSTYNWEKPAALMAAVQDVYINSNDDLTGLVKVCKEFNKLIKCLNAEKLDVDTCISAKWLLHNQQHVDKAYPYAMLMKQIRWQCSAGFYPAYDNWNCIAKAYRNRNATLISCINSFRTNANHAPEYEICKYAASGKRCYQQAFYETCPDSAAVRNYGCESFRQYVLAEFPQCDDFCEALILLACAAADKIPVFKSCDSSQFNQCTRRLVENIGKPLDFSNVWLDPTMFNDILEQKFIADDNMDNVAKICNGLQIFYACLGPHLTNCLSAEGLTTVKQMEPLIAYAYIGYLNMWRFQCGAGFYALEKTSSLACIQNTMRNQFLALNEAANTYRSNVEHDPSNACSHAKTLQEVFRVIYTAGKCKDEGKAYLAGWWACEGQKEYTEAEYRECSHINRCEFKKEATPRTDRIKFVGEKMLVKIGPTWKKTETGEWYEEPEKWI